ncbi:MAG TPA: hypothetical protein VGT02_11350, partial [Methylomirabilota bacterium]|nr:hypothetical protein [Methylomirabilota bacterium]
MRQMLAIVMLLGALLATPASAQDERVFDLTGDWKDANGKATTFSQFLDDKGARIVVVRSADCRDPLSETCLEFRGPITGSKLALTHKITAGTVGGLYGPLAPEVKTQVVGKLEVTLDGEIVDEGERIVARLQIPQFSVDKKTGALVDKGTKPVKTSFSARARLLVRESHEQSSASNRNLPGVTEDQPFYVDLRVPRVDAKRVGDFAEIEFLVKDTGKTTHLRLGSQNAAYRGTVVYTTPSTITIQGGGEGAGKDGALGNLFSSMAGGLAPGNMFGLKVPNGGIVVITYKDATTTASTEVRVFHSRTKLALGLCQSALDDLYTLYGRMLSQWADRLTPDGSKALRSKMRAIENERRIIEFEPKETDKYHFFFADTTRLKACEGYFQYVLSDPATWNAGDPREYSGGGVGFKGPDVRFPGVDYEAWRESQIVGFAIRDGEEMWKTIAWKSIADLTIDLYQVYIGITLADQLWIAVDGTNPVTGKRVDLSERVMAGVGFASNVALGVLGGQALKDRQATWAGERPGFTGDPGPAHSKPGDWVSKTNPDGTKPRGLSEGSAIKPLESPRAPTPRNNPILTPGTPENKAYFGGIADEAKGRTPEGGRPTGEARPTPEPAKPTAPAPTPAAEPVKPAEPAKPTMTGEAPPPSEQPKPPSSSDSGGLMGKVGSGEKPNEPLGGVGGGSEPPRTTKLPPPEMPEPAPTGTTKLPPPEMPEPAPPKTAKLPAPEMPEPAPPKTTKLPAPEMPEPAPPKTTKLPAPEMPEPAPPK